MSTRLVQFSKILFTITGWQGEIRCEPASFPSPYACTAAKGNTHLAAPIRAEQERHAESSTTITIPGERGIH